MNYCAGCERNKREYFSFMKFAVPISALIAFNSFHYEPGFIPAVSCATGVSLEEIPFDIMEEPGDFYTTPNLYQIV